MKCLKVYRVEAIRNKKPRRNQWKFLKLCAPVITDTLTYLYNLFWCYFPMTFKKAKVIPLYKSGDLTDRSNYRPISLSLLSKPLEKHIQKHLSLHLGNNDLIHKNQSGFRDNHSCHTALIQLVDTCLTSINNNEFTGVLFVDFAKAFDVINHARLLKTLTRYQLSTESLELISSFLCDRQQLVEINSSRS